MLRVPQLQQEAQVRYMTLLEEAAKLSGYTKEQLNTRTYPQIGYRYAAYLIMREDGFTLKEIAKASGFNHATVYHGAAYASEALRYGSDKNVVNCYRTLKEVANGLPRENQMLTTQGRIEKWLKDNETPEPLYDKLIGSLAAIAY